MNFEDYKNKYFDGDEDKAIHQLAYEQYNNKFTYYLNKKEACRVFDTLTEKQKDRHVDFLAEETNKNPANFLLGLQKASVLINSGLTYEEIKETNTNPFKLKIGKTILKAFAGIAVIVIFMLITVSMDMDRLAEIGPYIIGVFGSYIAIELTSNITNYFRFKKAKKDIESNEG